MTEARVIEKKVLFRIENHQIRANIDTNSVKIAKIAERGPTGPKGEMGLQGPIGPAGEASTMVVLVSLPSNVWTISHNLGKYPMVIVHDSAGTTVEGDIEYLDLNTVRISFSGTFSGTVFLN